MAYFRNKDANIFYILDGPTDGPVIVCLHGWACDLHDWNFQIEFLHNLGFRTLAVDHRGHGRSPVPTDLKTLDAETLADDTAMLLEHLGIRQAVMMGHSLGAVVASILAIKYPGLAIALILSDPMYNTSKEQLRQQIEFLSGPSACDKASEMFKSAGYTLQTPQWMISWHTRRVLGTPAAVVFRTLLETYGRDDGFGSKENALKRFKDRKTPRLVVCASDNSATVDRALPAGENDKIIVIENSSHWPHQQEAARFNQLVADWLTQLGIVPKNVK